MEKVIILDFGSQYTQLIARRVRENNVYSEIVPYNISPDQIGDDVIAIILSGGPGSVYDERPYLPDKRIFELGKPILGICYGLQIIAHMLGGKVAPAGEKEYGYAELEIIKDSPLFSNIPDLKVQDHKRNEDTPHLTPPPTHEVRGGRMGVRKFRVWMSHGDRVLSIPENFRVIARTANSPYAAISDEKRKIYGLQFHPEVVHTKYGTEIIRNFLYEIAGAKGEWKLENYVETMIAEIREKVDGNGVILALSGGVDSSVVAYLLAKAVGENFYPIFIDTGLLKIGETERIKKFFGHLKNLRIIDAREIFLNALKGVKDPEEKRKIIGEKFIEVFRDESLKLKDKIKFLAQGTLYPDVIESTPVVGPSETIKSHHNVGGLPDWLPFELLEPLKMLFKDEVRKIGKILGMPDELISRHPFPGPGFAIRIIGEVTEESLSLVKMADLIIEEEIKNAGLYEELWQVFPVLLPIKTVGVMGDKRTYEYVVALRAVTSVDGMTADWAKLPYDVLERISSRIVNEITGINRVVFDVTSKPPATIEWE